MGVEIGARIYKLNAEFFVTGPSKEILQITTDDFTVLADIKLELCDIVYSTYDMGSDHSIILKLFIILDDHDYNYIKEKIS